MRSAHHASEAQAKRREKGKPTNNKKSSGRREKERKREKQENPFLRITCRCSAADVNAVAAAARLVVVSRRQMRNDREKGRE